MGNQTYPVALHVPITLKHFQLLARLGRMPSFYLYHEIENGAEFFLDENDYITKNDEVMNLEAKHKVKVEGSPNPLPSFSSSSPAPASNRGKKRPRRSTAVTVQSYAVPDSDDEDIVDEDEDSCFRIGDQEKKSKETNLHLWIKHLSVILKAETRKYTEMKKRIEKSSEPDAKVRIHRNEFVKSLTTNLRNLRKIAETRQKFYGYHDVVQDYSDDEDDDYMARRTKKRKAAYISL